MASSYCISSVCMFNGIPVSTQDEEKASEDIGHTEVRDGIGTATPDRGKQNVILYQYQS